MPVPSKMADLFTIAASNSPAGSDLIGNSLDDYIRSGFAILRSTNALASASIAAASTTDLSTADAESVQITGSATINSLGTAVSGLIRECRFTGACTLVNSGAISLPGSANLATAAGDVITFRSLGSGNWTLVASTNGSYLPFLPLAGGTLTGSLAGTTANFSGALTALSINSSANFISTTTAAVVATTGAGSVILRPNGVGSTSGQASLSSSGAIQFAGDVTGAQNFIGAGTAAVLAPASAGSAILRPNGTGSTSGQLFVSSSGDVTCGGTNVFVGQNYVASGTAAVLATTGAGTVILRPNGTGSTSGQLSLNSSGIATAVDFQATSDRGLKTDIKRLSRGLIELKRMPPVQYVKGGRPEIGFIAQDAREVIPEAVSADDDGRLSLSYGQTIALVASAVLELAERLEEKGVL